MQEQTDVDAERVPVYEFDLMDPAIADTFYERVVEGRDREGCPIAWTAAQGGGWHIARYEDVLAAADQPDLFTAELGVAPIQGDLEQLRLVPLENDDPKHALIRDALWPFFTRRAIEKFEPAIRAIVQQILVECEKESPCDFIPNFAARVPSQVFSAVILGERDPEAVAFLESMIEQIFADPANMAEVIGPLVQWCYKVIADRAGDPSRDDVIGVIANMGRGELPGFELTDRDRAETLNLLIVGGMESTGFMLGSVVQKLASDQLLREELRGASSAKLHRAVSEFVRWQAPVTMSSRHLTADAEFGGCPMRVGDRVWLSWGAASLDPEVYPDPFTFDPNRKNASKHASFGAGVHRCLGAQLAEAEMRLTIEEVCKLETFELMEQEHHYRAGLLYGPISVMINAAR